MKLSTRLLLILLPIVTVVMVLYAAWSLHERETTVVQQADQEIRAYATALALAIQYAVDDLERGNVQQVINQISRDPKIYAILVYGTDGRPLLVSDSVTTPTSAPREYLDSVLAGGQTALFRREIEGQRVYSVLRPIRSTSGDVTGALEVAQPMSFLETEQDLIRRRYLLNTLTLLAAVAILILWLVQRFVRQPMQGFVHAVQALGRGDFAHRIGEHHSTSELAELAQEFNTLASRLDGARQALLHEAEGRVTLERRLRQAEKLAAIGNLAAGLAHEIAAPLNVISGRSEVLLRREVTPEVRRRALRIIIRQIGRITTVVRNLLDFARRREPRFQRVDLAVVVDSAANFLETEFERVGVIVSRQETRPLWADGDPDLLHQVLVNLFLNAIQALDGVEGYRRITTRLADAAVAPNGDGWTKLEIVDNGPGIPEEVVTRLFEPFNTTKPTGTGLGLVIAQGILEEHGGRLEAYNAIDGEGAVFRLSLPIRATGTNGA
ncbi:MAG TPA: ATP-binding protein [Steroidobacteraceae bacterium]